MAGLAYQWSPAAGLSSPTIANPTVTLPNPGPDTLTVPYVLTTTSVGGCVRRDTALVTVYPAPAPDTIDGSRSVCPTVPGVAYRVRNPRNATYQWTVTGGTLVGGQGTASITVDWGPASANASVRVVGSTAAGCPAAPAVLPVRINQRAGHGPAHRAAAGVRGQPLHLPNPVY